MKINKLIAKGGTLTVRQVICYLRVIRESDKLPQGICLGVPDCFPGVSLEEDDLFLEFYSWLEKELPPARYGINKNLSFPAGDTAARIKWIDNKVAELWARIRST